MMTEIAPDFETVTAVLTSHLESGEDFEGAILIGYYPSNNDEVWIESHGQRTTIQCSDVDALCKQLKRAKRIAMEQEVPQP
jgi:hypothetical protein